MNYKSIIKNLLPPVIHNIIKPKPKYGFFGFYPDWQTAFKYSTGWHSGIVLEKVKNSLLQVQQGQAVYERDSVLFNEVQSSWPLLAGLLRIAAENKGHLKVVDFGGSLGTTYFQNKNFLSDLKLEWNIVEQPSYVQVGNENFANDELKFFDDWDKCLQVTAPDVLIASSVIQYLEDPFTMIQKFIQARIPYIIFDRTSFIKTPDHKIGIQKVPPSIYPAVFPIWFFNYEKFLNLFKPDYKIIAEFKAFVADSFKVEGIPGGDKGFILKHI